MICGIKTVFMYLSEKNIYEGYTRILGLCYCSDMNTDCPVLSNRDWRRNIVRCVNMSNSLSGERNWGSQNNFSILLGSWITSLRVLTIDWKIQSHKPSTHSLFPSRICCVLRVEGEAASKKSVNVSKRGNPKPNNQNFHWLGAAGSNEHCNIYLYCLTNCTTSVLDNTST